VTGSSVKLFMLRWSQTTGAALSQDSSTSALLRISLLACPLKTIAPRRPSPIDKASFYDDAGCRRHKIHKNCCDSCVFLWLFSSRLDSKPMCAVA
jgi:hypothetical protein